MTRLHVSDLGHQILRGLYTHRLLTADLIHHLYGAAYTQRWPLATLARLHRAGFVDWVTTARSRRRAWYLTPGGIDITEGVDEVRPYQMTPARAAGPLQSHTLAVNAVGVAFVLAARCYDDVCGPCDWRNETALFDSSPRPRVIVTADARLDYTAYDSGVPTHLVQYLEVDRSTMDLGRVVAKLEAYSRWARLARVTPHVTVVVDDEPGPGLERRLDRLNARLDTSVAIANADVTIAVTTLAQLYDPGPHAPIFWQYGLDHLVDMRGRPLDRALLFA